MKSPFEKYHFFLLALMLLSSLAYPQKKDSRIFDDSQLKISELSTNSIHSDFGPTVIHDMLYFTTFNDKFIRKNGKTLNQKEFYDLYEAKIDKQGNTIGAREPLKEFITRFNDGPVAWCEKTGELFITQNYIDRSVLKKPFSDEIIRLKIIIFKQINGSWQHVSDFPYFNTEYSVGHPAITESGDTLLFSSDMPRGYGETDLYYSVRKNGNWVVPVNLGPNINTSGKEEFAFLTDRHFDGCFLIFSSTGRNGDGGLDLYYTRFPSDYSEIGHFGSPVNTPNDDFAMVIPTDADFGYLTSNRPGTGDDDIYKFTFKRIIRQVKKFRMLYILDKNSMRPISGVNILSCDKQKHVSDTEGKVSDLPCNEVECEISASAVGYSNKTKVLLACKMSNEEIERDTIWMDMITNRKIVLRDIYYDYDKWDILPESAKELDRLVSLMKENPEMKVELSSHTDDRGTILYNLKLSQLRAQVAVDYIVSKGIDKMRISGKGYGKSQLINNCTIEKPCSSVQHRENRRTEIYIPGFLRGEPVKQDKGDFSDGKPDHSLGYSSFAVHGFDFEKGTITSIKATEAGINGSDNVIKGTNPMKYYLILGSFPEKTSALKFTQQLIAEGFKATILNESEHIWVGIGYDHFSQAKKSLEMFKGKQPSSWIYQSK